MVNIPFYITKYELKKVLNIIIVFNDVLNGNTYSIQPFLKGIKSRTK